jgi:hypothetical protein
MSAAEILTVNQGTEEWFRMRLGVLTASKAYDILPSKRGGGFKEARTTYMNQLIAEVCTGHYEEINAKPLEWGKVNEVAARAAYQFESGIEVKEGGFMYAYNKRAGCSPDFIAKTMNKGGEIKCPWNPANHIKFLIEDEIKDEWIAQMQFQLWVSGFDAWDFASFDPRMKTKMIQIKEILRDPKMMALFDEIVPAFIVEMDEKLEKIGIPFGSQWL